MLDQATPLAGAVARLWGELLATRHAPWLCEAELAVGVPLVISEPDELRVLGERLEAVLKVVPKQPAAMRPRSTCSTRPPPS